MKFTLLIFSLIPIFLFAVDSKPGKKDFAPVSQKYIAPLDGNDLLPDGRFRDCEIDFFPAGWMIAHGVNHSFPNDVRIVSEKEGKRFLRIVLGKGQNLMLKRHIPVNPEWKRMRLTVTMRVPECTPGKEKWQSPSVVVYFYDSHGKRINKYPATVIQRSASSEFQTFIKEFAMDPNAAELAIYAGLYGGRGSADFELIQLHELK